MFLPQSAHSSSPPCLTVLDPPPAHTVGPLFLLQIRLDLHHHWMKIPHLLAPKGLWLTVIKIIIINLHVSCHMYLSSPRIVNPVLIFAFISNKNPLPRSFIQLLSFFLRNMHPSSTAYNFHIAQFWLFSF